MKEGVSTILLWCIDAIWACFYNSDGIDLEYFGGY
jgi:hypothetical protein